MPSMPIFSGLEPHEEKSFSKYVQNVLDLARSAWDAGHKDFVVVVSDRTVQMLTIDREKAVTIVEESLGEGSLATTLGKPAGPMAVWVVYLFNNGTEDTANVMKMTFMPSLSKGGSA